MFKHYMKELSFILLFLSLGFSGNSRAYYDKLNWAEVYIIQPNHSAFLIPLTGDTKGDQAKFESVSFLNDKKVGAKRIEIPHVVLKNSGAVDYWVNSQLLIVLDRAPFVNTWTKEPNATSPSNQEMCVESQDGIGFCFDTSIGANITEEDAAAYLYWFGVQPKKDGTAEEQKFSSMLHGMHLGDVMNTRVFGRIHAAYYQEFSKYKFKDLLEHKQEILDSVQKMAITEYKKMGITIEYVGIASNFRYKNTGITNSLESLVTAELDSLASEHKLKALQVSQKEADIYVQKMKVYPYSKWDGHTFPNVPQFLMSNETIASFVAKVKELVQ